MKTQSFKFLLFALFVSIFTGAISQEAPERTEPPFWWADMHHSTLQIMVYAENIGNTRPSIDYPGVTLTDIILVNNPNYIFLNLDIADADPGSFPIRFSSNDSEVYVYNYELKRRLPDAHQKKGFDASDAIYLLMPDRFANGDTSNDQVEGMLEGVNRDNPDGRQGGDIQGIIDHLDYIREMGFSALWINPLLENNQPEYSYHGYAATDFYKIDPRFGTNQDYQRLVQEAEQRDMKIIKDMIFNHIGDQHWWMKDLPDKNWINNWDEFTKTSYRITTILDPHAAESDYRKMVDGWFDGHMPDLNQENPLLATYLIQNSVWWIEYAGIHGIRMDTQPYADRFFMADWGKYVMAEYPDFRIVGESWIGVPAIKSYFQGGEIQFDGYDSHINSVFDFSLYDAIGPGFTEGEGWSEGLMRLYNSLAQDFLYSDPFNLVVFGDNHDTDRIYTRVNQNKDKLKMALTHIFTTRGIPMIYTGTELLEAGYEHDGHGELRSTFPGGFPGDKTNAFTKRGRTRDQNDIVDHISELLKFRSENQVMHYGRLKQFVPENNVYTYFRYNEDEAVMVILNSNDENVELDTRRFAEATANYNSATDLLSEKTFNDFNTWKIPANTSMVLQLK